MTPVKGSLFDSQRGHDPSVEKLATWTLVSPLLAAHTVTQEVCGYMFHIPTINAVPI